MSWSGDLKRPEESADMLSDQELAPTFSKRTRTETLALQHLKSGS